MLVILCTVLPITATIAGQWLNSLVFHDDIKCIIANEKMIKLNTCDDYSFCTKDWKTLSHS